MTWATPFLVDGRADEVGDVEHALVGVRHGDPVAGPFEELDVVLAVPEGDRPLAARSRGARRRTAARGLRHLRARELEEERQRLGDVQARREVRLHALLEAVEALGLADGDELRRRLSSHASRSPTSCTWRPWKAA